MFESPDITRPLQCLFDRGTITGADPERPILVARLKGSRESGALALLNHADVVPPGDLAKWTSPPFAGQRGTGLDRTLLFGRGTLDMKGQTVANLLAMAALTRAGVVPLNDIVFVVESGEETFRDDLGMGWVYDHRPELLAGVTDVFNEGGVNEVKTQRVERFGVETMQKAVVSMDVLSPESKPLEEFRDFLKARDLEEPVRVVPAVREFLRFIAPSRSDVWGRYMMDGAEKLVPNPELWKSVPEVYRSLLKDAIYEGRVEKVAGGYSMRAVTHAASGKPGGGRARPARGLGPGEGARPPPRLRDERLRVEPHRRERVPRDRERVRSGPGGRARGSLHPERTEHVGGRHPRPRRPGVRRVPVRGEHLRRVDDPSPERAHFPAAFRRRNRADAADPPRVRDGALREPAARLPGSGSGTLLAS